MLTIEKNTFLENGFVRYQDEYGNEIVCQRLDDGFEVRPKFAEHGIRAFGMKFEMPIPEDKEQVRVDLAFRNGPVDMEREDIKAMWSDIEEIVDRWACMLTDIEFYGTDNDLLLKAKPELEATDVWGYKYSLISDYEELKELANMIMREE